MRVNQPTSSSQVKPTDQPLELRDGEVYSVKIKEQVSDNEAIVQIRGKEVRVQFEGKVPQGERVAVQITDSQTQVPQVKTVAINSANSGGEPDLGTVLRNLGAAATPELKLSAKILMDAGIPLNKEAVRDLKDFMEKLPGSMKQKLETVQAVANKKLDVTVAHLRSVHEALHGQPLTGALSDLAKNANKTVGSKPDLPLPTIVSNAKELLEREPSLQKAIQQVRELVANNPKIGQEAAAKIEKALIEAQQLLQRGHERAGREHLLQTVKQAEQSALKQAQPVSAEQPVKDVVSQAKEIVQREPNLQKAIQQVRELVANNPKIEREAAAKLEKALMEAQQLLQKGLERAGREHLLQAVKQVDVQSTGRQAVGSQPPVNTGSVLAQSKEAVKQEPNLDKAVQLIKTQLVNNLKLEPEVATKVEKALLEAVKLQQAGREGTARLLLMQTLEQVEAQTGGTQSLIQAVKDSGTLQSDGVTPSFSPSGSGQQSVRADGIIISNQLVETLKTMIKQAPSLEQAMQQFLDQANALPQLNQEAVAKVEKALAQAVSLQKIGWEQVGRDQVMKVLDQVADELVPNSETLDLLDPVSIGARTYDENAGIQMGAFLATKDLVVTEITQKLSQAATHFQSVKRELVRNIDNMIQVAETNRGNILSGVKPLLESTIDMLDKAILKSEITMLTDMETEKQLMKASGDLAEARRLLTKGDNEQAMAVLKDVKAKLDALQWRPSNVRIQHFMTGQSIFGDEAPQASNLLHQVTEAAQHFQSQPPSARNTFEFFRSMGLNYDSEVAQFLSSGQSQQGGHEDLHKNLKAALLQLSKAEEGQSLPNHGNHSVEQALQNVTGQQLLSKSEAGTHLQSMFFQLPLLLENGLENLKLYVNSKNEGQKVDWENCSLYFLIETKKLGQTGIHISAVDRNLSITIKNDQPRIKERLEPLVAKCKENLTEIGYNIAGVTFTRFTEEKKPGQLQPSVPAAAKTSQQPSTFAKGFDFKI
ncbi:hypothetical protein [Brevibacillus borstelensis]|jgi:tetratricopeptide (TPR) repeat protein/predicted RNA-binding protein with TRAM domain|uniref:hypothetical protein n=1 Tax=Brevibacillus borstelensis TaxID=45462 RepID=UPI002E226EFE|nr:hypothetical protein [Brevibacillus borstelensis]